MRLRKNYGPDKGNLSKIFCSVIYVESDLYIQVIELT